MVLFPPPLWVVLLSLFRVGGATYSSSIFSLGCVQLPLILWCGADFPSLLLGGVASPRLGLCVLLLVVGPWRCRCLFTLAMVTLLGDAASLIGLGTSWELTSLESQ